MISSDSQSARIMNLMPTDRRRRHSILVVDDEPDVVRSVQDLSPELTQKIRAMYPN